MSKRIRLALLTGFIFFSGFCVAWTPDFSEWFKSLAQMFGVKGAEVVESLKVDYKIPADKIKSVKLDNGMTVIAYQDNTNPKVLVQVAYDVGSSMETSLEKGLAHLVEHMIFKGTEKMSESDVSQIGRQFGAEFNAYTSNDLTSYYFLTDKANWKPFVDVLQDCMKNARFDSEHLASELKAVVQELNMRRDNHFLLMIERALELSFPANHPYHYPIIGFKEELAALSAQDIKNFYDKYYNPDKAVIFVAGDIDLDEAVDYVKKKFEGIKKSDKHYSPSFPKWIPSLTSNKTLMYEDVQKEKVLFYWRIPGLSDGMPGLADIANDIFADGVGSRLYSRLVDKDQIAEGLLSYAYEMHYGGIFLIQVTPKDGQKERCRSVLKEEIEKIIQDGVSEHELNRSVAVHVSNFLNQLDSPLGLVHEWVSSYLITKDVKDVFAKVDQLYNLTPAHIQSFFSDYIDPENVGEVELLKLKDSQKDNWKESKSMIEAQELAILQNHQRTAPLEPPRYSKTLSKPASFEFQFPKPTSVETIGDLRTIFYKDSSTPMTHVKVAFKDSEYLSSSKKGLITGLMMQMLLEGSYGNTKDEDVDFIKSLGAGASFNAAGGALSVLDVNLPRALDRFLHILKNPSFRNDAFEKCKAIVMANLQSSKDSQMSIAKRLFASNIFAGTDYEWNYDEAIEMVSQSTVKDIVDLHSALVNPKSLVFSIAGSFDIDGVKASIQKALKGWSSDEYSGGYSLPVPNFDFQKNEDVPMMRDQVVLFLAKPSKVNLYDEDRIPLGILNTITFASLGSRIYNVREATGLFYAAGGGFGSNAGKVSSLDYIVTQLNPDNAEAGEAMLKQAVEKVVADGVTEQELSDAKQIYINSVLEMFSSRSDIASAMARMEIYNLGFDYYDKVWEKINSLTVENLNAIARKYYGTAKMSRIRVGSLPSSK